MRINLIVILFALGPSLSIAQAVMVNHNCSMVVTNNANVVVVGGITDQASGTFDNSGTVWLTNDWTNNAGNTAFVNSSPGLTVFNGNAQSITGFDITRFYDLSLQGGGIKTQTLDAITEDSLALNDRELATGDFIMYVENPTTTAITRSGVVVPPFDNTTNEGMVSSTNAGALARAVNSTAAYTFPVGSSSGTARFRPAVISPNSAIADTFFVRMANVDPTSEGFDRTIMDSLLCEVNPDFYHRIWHSGTSASDVLITYDDVTEGQFTTLAHWQNAPQWEGMSPVNTSGNVSPTLSHHFKSAWTDFSFPAFALARPGFSIALTAVDTALCQGDSTSITATGGGNSYNWSSSDTTATISVNPGATTTYLVTVSDGSCNQTDSIIISVNSPVTPTILGNDTICPGDSTTLSVASGTSFNWSTGSSNDSIVINPNVNTQYTVTVSDGACLDSASVMVFVLSNPTATITGGTSICAGSSTSLSATGGASYLWNTGDNTSTINFSPTSSGFYVVTVSDLCGAVTDSVLVNVNPIPIVNAGNDTIIFINGAANLNATTTDTSNVYWTPAADLSCNTCLDPVASPSQTTSYVVLVTANGCTASDTVTVEINSSSTIFIPNIFSPNNDGANDIFFVRGNFETVAVRVYNRWGELVFQTTDVNTGWDGTFRGQALNPGVFVFHVTGRVAGNAVEEKGNLTLMR